MEIFHFRKGISMYPEWLSMDNQILWGAILLIGHLISTVLALAIFSSIFRSNKNRGYIFLVLLMFIGYLNLKNVLIFSSTLGILIGLMYLVMGIVTYLSLKKRLADKSSR